MDLHVGGPGSPLVLRGVPQDVARVITLLDGCHGRDDLAEILEESWLTWLVTTLEAGGFLADGPPAKPAGVVRLLGQGRLARQIGDLLVRSGVTAAGRSEAAGLTIVASDSADTDRILLADLTRRGLAHLVVRAGEESAGVGPFVIPGITSCATCADLTRRELDPTWPVEVFQLARWPTYPDPVLCSWAAATAVAHTLAHAGGLTPESASSTIEMTIPGHNLTYRAWPRHPGCECHVKAGD